ncbi:MAG: molybdopterin-dependent oxidoreductase [Phycisphaerales bacterium]|nr:molybdopterin-dependent oxidoreductase [Phycisphaerae bacterium]NNF43067.1 molybdopterin-dependent oxidoreductase [Phycisphaerales bacterium]NNM25054.1 molybdopterin-dependent oxidoreductase [Phycisphaerales bacterium]
MPPADRATMNVTPLASFPPVDAWDDWVEYDAKAWPKKVERRYRLVPTTCFNCEAACGLVAYVDRETMQVQRLEGNPHHPGSRGRNCAKGPATINQIEDPGRILYPMKRVGERGSGQFERTTWDEVLDTLAGRIRRALQEERRNEIMYHVGRPGEDGFMGRVLQSWGIDGHNSHTNVCSSAARVGYALWSGADRPSPDHANAKFILLLSAHLETGHYFNPHAQRIVEAKNAGAKLCVIDVRLSNTASAADYWLAPWPGTEAVLLLAMAHVILQEDLYDRGFLEQWVNWRAYLAALHPDDEVTFERFLTRLKERYADVTPEAAAAECRVDADTLREVAREIGRTGGAFATHVWRNAAAGNLGGWQVARCLQFLVVLVGGVGAVGGTNPNSRNKFVPPPFLKPPPQNVWSELLYPREYPLAYHELSYLLPHFLEEGRGAIDVYFTRVYNPVWTNPDGMMWERMLRDESKIGVHAALTPVWSETAQYADYVLPMGNGAERHDLMSQETHAARWISFRQPVTRVARERAGERVELTYHSNPGEVWEEDEFWIELSWRIDPDGSLGIRRYYESPTRPGEKITVDEYYGWIFENSVPGLPEEAAKHGLSPLEYMRRFGAFLVEDDAYEGHRAPLDEATVVKADVHDDGTIVKDDTPVGIKVGDTACAGFATPSRRLEIYSPTMAEWGWPEHTLPGSIESHVHHRHVDHDRGQYVLVPTFRLPTLIHTRSANAKWLYELSNTNPVWINPADAARIGVETGGLIRVTTDIGHYVNRAWVTEGMRPGVVACSHHLGRWRLFDDAGTDRWASATVAREEIAPGVYRFRRVKDITAYTSADPDTRRIWWTDGGVHQNMTFPVHPDPISGMHCWHQLVTVTPARPGDRYADIEVDTTKSMEIYRQWLALTRPAPGPGGLRRPRWFARAMKPAAETYVIRG